MFYRGKKKMKRLLFLVLILFSVCCSEEALGEDELRVECKRPGGRVEVYRVKIKSLFDLTRSRSAFWHFVGVRKSDGKRVEVVSNECYVEREVKR
tara:strand:- start:137 stop:421 length:285 start_codon:yes stop_codon:yes gene_type:complete